MAQYENLTGWEKLSLTDVQYAYWVGRDERQALGGIGCHAYLEFDGKAVDQSRLRHAWAVVQQHHPMLRACFLNNGAQKILAKPYKGELKINDYSSMQEEEAQRAALSIRNRLSHRKLHIEKGEVAGLELTLLPHGKTRLHIDVVEYEEYRKLGINQKLRLILMSGDWIPVALPDRVRGILRTVKMEALGGATEASIWSNCYEIPDVIPENWKSIPYGKPLANQKYYILDQNMENCPNWVPGNLYIAGEGIALGYLNDEEKTKEKFIIWEKTGEKLYSTGDMGRYWSDGNIEFLGRVDNQIKINGYRVEIGEIENALYATSLVKKCMVSYEKDKLCAYIIKETESINVMDLQEQLSKILPEYMIPKLFYLVDEIPLTSNGKIDLGKMKNKVVLSEKDKINIAETVTEKELVSVWETVVGKKNMDIDESFFESGGDSIKIIRFINKINELYHKDISLHVIGENQTIRKLAKYIEGLNEENYLTITI